MGHRSQVTGHRSGYRSQVTGHISQVTKNPVIFEFTVCSYFFWGGGGGGGLAFFLAMLFISLKL